MRHRALAFTTVCLLTATATQAANIDLTPAVSGEVSAYLVGGFFSSSETYTHHTFLSDLQTSAGSSTSCFCAWDSRESGYIGYDLSSVNIDVTSAYLKVDLTAYNIYAPDQLNIHAINGYTVSGLQALPVGDLPLAEGQALFNAMDNGALYSAANATGSATAYQFHFNAEGLDALNSGDDELLLALIVPQVGVNSVYVNSTPTLHLSGVPKVPIPAAAWLFGSALLGLGFAKRMKA